MNTFELLAVDIRKHLEQKYGTADLDEADRDDAWTTALSMVPSLVSGEAALERAYESTAHVTIEVERVVREQAAKRAARGAA